MYIWECAALLLEQQHSPTRLGRRRGSSSLCCIIIAAAQRAWKRPGPQKKPGGVWRHIARLSHTTHSPRGPRRCRVRRVCARRASQGHTILHHCVRIMAAARVALPPPPLCDCCLNRPLRARIDTHAHTHTPMYDDAACRHARACMHRSKIQIIDSLLKQPRRGAHPPSHTHTGLGVFGALVGGCGVPRRFVLLLGCLRRVRTHTGAPSVYILYRVVSGVDRNWFV